MELSELKGVEFIPNDKKDTKKYNLNELTIAGSDEKKISN